MLQIHPVRRHQNVNNFGLAIFTIFHSTVVHVWSIENTIWVYRLVLDHHYAHYYIYIYIIWPWPVVLFVSGRSDAQSMPGKKHDHDNEEHQGSFHDSGDYYRELESGATGAPPGPNPNCRPGPALEEADHPLGASELSTVRACISGGKLTEEVYG